MGWRQAGDDPHRRRRRRQAGAGLHRRRKQPVPRPARHPPVAGTTGDLPRADPGAAARRGARQSEGDVPDDFRAGRIRSRRCACLPTRPRSWRMRALRMPLPPLGIMVEVPSVAIAPELFSDVAFFSIGSNDLTQYVMAAARDNASVARAEFDPINPAVLRLIAAVAEFGEAHGIPVSLCGDAGGDPAAIPASARGRPARPVGGAGAAGAGQGGDRRRHGLRHGKASRQRHRRCREAIRAYKSVLSARDRPAPVGHPPAPCRCARQAPQLRHADHQPDLFDADPVEAPAGDLLRLPFQPAGARHVPQRLPRRASGQGFDDGDDAHVRGISR